MDSFSASLEKMIKLTIVICLVSMVVATNAKIKGYFQCTNRPPKAINCAHSDLPDVDNGYFNCSGYTVGAKCNLICDDGYYRSSSKEVICEEKGSSYGKWTVRNFQCSAIMCTHSNLPDVDEGYFNCSGNTVGAKCNLTCNDGYYPSSSKEVICEEKGGSYGNWTVGNFQCPAIKCAHSNLPDVDEGYFSCSAYTVGAKCNLTCDDGYYPSSSKEVVCEEKGGSNGKWTVGNFQCYAIKCEHSDLPNVNEGYFNCSGYTVGARCNLTCNDGYYPSSSKETICEVRDKFEGNWTGGNFACRDCNEWILFNGKGYKFITTHNRWGISLQLCKYEGAYLVKIENEEENDFVHKVLSHCTDEQYIQIGLNYHEMEGLYKWCDNAYAEYLNWDSGEPTSSRLENCGCMNRINKKWHDYPCKRFYTSVCEREQSP